MRYYNKFTRIRDSYINITIRQYNEYFPDLLIIFVQTQISRSYKYFTLTIYNKLHNWNSSSKINDFIVKHEELNTFI